MSREAQPFAAEAERHIQACLLSAEAPEGNLQALEQMLQEDSDRANVIALRLLDDNLIHNWFRSEADVSFIDEVRRRLELHFNDPAFVEAAMGRIQDAVTATPGLPGATIRKAPKKHSAMKYLLVPLVAALVYIVLAYHPQLIGFFSSSPDQIMTVQDFFGQPSVTTAEREKAIIRKMLIHPGDRLTAGKNEKIVLAYPDETQMELSGGGQLLLGTDTGHKQLQLSSGALELTVTPQSKDRPVLVKTPNAELTIVQASVRLEISGAVDRVIVSSGTVEVRKLTGGDPIPVGAGQTASIRAKQIIVQSSAPSPE